MAKKDQELMVAPSEQALAELRCAKAQGYLISHPVPPESIGSTVASLTQFGEWSKLRGRNPR